MRRYRRELSVAAAIAALLVSLAIVAPGFFSAGNATDLVLANLPVMIVAIGMTGVILTGQIDISVGSQFALCGVACGAFAKLGMPVLLAVAAACATGGLLGVMNGALIAYLGLPSIVVTLAAMVAWRDALRWATEGAWIQDLPSDFQWFGLSQPASGNVSALAAIVLLTIAAGVLGFMSIGRAFYATGSDSNAARLAGIDPKRITFCAFLLTGILTGFAAALNAVRFNQIPSNAGIGLEIKVIAAVVIGGTSITGGRGSVLGTALGVILLGIIGPGLTFIGVSAWWERAFQGGIILGAVALDALRFPWGTHATRAAVQSR